MSQFARAACVAFSWILVAACSKPSTESSPSAQTQNAVATDSAAAASPPPPASAPQAETAPTFWKKFRDAVLADDKPTLLSVTQFPFQAHGTTDDDPVVPVEEKDFWPTYTRLLAQKAASGDGKTERQLIESSAELPANALDGNTPAEQERATQFVVGALQFEKTAAGWRWAGAYLEEQ